ncbi:AAA+ ATPase domain [Heracleum sosnowskyi]|uniref:AAA+ ATPase domain n=1 Tax=Heracleum sosnowskyi TaxID=360622 RepID=A0AAD8I395_9APIA|nr:AAA+ ATPase domain [Heracleum sosnowskyi]
MDGRRHSVDIPISKALVALRRVRSLRDPSTNCSSRLSPLVDGLHWETNSNNGITLGFANGGIDGDDALESKDVGLYGQRREHESDCEVYYSKRKHTSKLACFEYPDFADYCPARTIQEESDLILTNQEESCENTLPSEKYYREYKDKKVGLIGKTPLEDCSEETGSCHETLEGSVRAERLDQNASKRNSRYKSRIRSSRVGTGDVMSRTGSPCLSMGDVPVEKSSHSPSLYDNEDVDAVYLNHQGCGISRCWSKTPRFRESDFSSDLEERPLMLEGVRATDHSEQRSRKHIGKEAIPYSESPRSLHQKFRPKSFSEVVGQDVVANSLLSAIANERIIPFYLFHGPRGTGKTSASRIFAAALNCLSREENKPCGTCQDCHAFFSGRSRDVKEVDSVRINRVDRIRWIIKSASAPPVSSRYKVFIIDECHLLRGSTWATILNAVDNFSRHVVFIMITPDLDKLPRSAVSRSQRYHFPKIKEIDTVCKLRKICVEEGIEFDQNALNFIATKSSGSLRDAEMMLEQLTLLGKKITLSIAYELVGMVSDEELLDLLDLALSSDTANTVKRARELMKCRIDPMHLTSQLANIIMDILAGNCLDGASEAKKKFMGRHTSEADLQHLSHALKVLSETEKQLRTSKNQTTWLTVALLQLNSGSSSLDANEATLCRSTVPTRDGELCSSSYSGESLKHHVTCACGKFDSCKMGIQEGKGTLESVWSRATEICESKSLRNFLQKKGQLTSVCFNEGLAVAELEFYSPAYVVKAEKSWKLIAAALQSTLGCNVEIRINLMRSNSDIKSTKVKKSFSLFSCSRRIRRHSQSTTELGSDPSENYTSLSEKPMIKEKSVAACSSDCGSQHSRICCHTRESVKTLRDSDGNALSVETTTSYRLLPENSPKPGYCRDDCCNGENSDTEEKQPGCFPRTMKVHKKLHASGNRQMAVFSLQPQHNLALANHSQTASQTYFCASDPYSFSNDCKNNTECHGNEDIQGRKDSKVYCWRTPTFPFKKAWQLRHQQPKRSHLVGWVLPCAAAK